MLQRGREEPLHPPPHGGQGRGQTRGGVVRILYWNIHQHSSLYVRFLQLSSEGVGWCSNLAQPDPYLILPVLVGLSFAATVFVSTDKLTAQLGEAGSKNNTFSAKVCSRL